MHKVTQFIIQQYFFTMIITLCVCILMPSSICFGISTFATQMLIANFRLKEVNLVLRNFLKSEVGN